MNASTHAAPRQSATIPPACGTGDAAVDTFRALSLARDLCVMTQWVTQARDVLEAVRQAAELDPRLQERLRAFEVPFYAASWEDEHGNAMQCLLSAQQDAITQAMRITGQA